MIGFMEIGLGIGLVLIFWVRFFIPYNRIISFAREMAWLDGDSEENPDRTSLKDAFRVPIKIDPPPMFIQTPREEELHSKPISLYLSDRLEEMDTDHSQNILDNENFIDQGYKKEIRKKTIALVNVVERALRRDRERKKTMKALLVEISDGKLKSQVGPLNRSEKSLFSPSIRLVQSEMQKLKFLSYQLNLE